MNQSLINNEKLVQNGLIGLILIIEFIDTVTDLSNLLDTVYRHLLMKTKPNFVQSWRSF